MLKNYIKIALRNIRRNPGYSAINIIGLAVGLAVSILILLYIQFELSYDEYHEDSDRIVRVTRAWFNQDGETSLHLGHAAPPFGPMLEEEFPGIIEEMVRFFQVSPLLRYEERSFVEDRFFFADPEVFGMFSWTMIHGDPETALQNPDALVLTRSMAIKYFGNENVLGETLEFQFQGVTLPMQVTGVVEDVPENSHFQFDFLGSMVPVIQFYGGMEAMMQNFGSNNFSTYLQLGTADDFNRLQDQIAGFIDRNLGSANQDVPASAGTMLILQRLTDIHLHSSLDSEIEANSRIEYIYVYSAIALFILVIACINFMNLSTARSARRATEVGLRKVIGADRGSLIRQFMGESVLITFISLFLAILMAEVSLPFVNDFIDKELEFRFFSDITHLIAPLALILFVGLAAGSYPALFLSGFQPALVLKGTFRAGKAHERFRSALVIAQFSISITLIASMIIVYNQLDFMRSKDLGFDKDHIAVLPANAQIISGYENIRERLLSHNGILNVSMSSRVPSGRLLDSQGTTAEVDGELRQINSRIADIHVSHDFMQTFGIDLVSGRDFDRNLASDSTQSFILNESAVQTIGWPSPEEALDKEFHYGGRRGRVIGVTEDFHFESLHQSIAPIVFLIPDQRINSVAVKVRGNQREEALAFLEEQWSVLRPGFPFTYYFVEESFNEQYEAESRLGTLFGFFSGLAVLIAALGLFGLASFTAQERRKEIGIRKVLGAGAYGIVLLLSKRFTLLVLISVAISVPLAWYGMNLWLENFAYRDTIPVSAFLAAGSLALLVAWFTISWQSIKAAMMNPVQSLRSE